MKKIRVLTLAIVIFLLSACGGTPPAPTSAPTMTLIPIIMPTQTDAQIETYHYSTEVAPGVSYGPPALSESVFLEGAGGSGRDGLMTQTGMSEEELGVYENALYDGAVQSGYTKDQIEIDYLYDTVHLSWNLVARLTSGNHLWSQRISDGVFSTFPLQIPYNETSKSIQWDTNYQLVEVQDSSDAIAFYTKEGVVILIGGPKVTIDGETYYSQWFNTNTGAWEDIPEVKTAYEAYLATLAPHDLEYYLDENNWEIVASEDEVIQKASEIAALPSQLLPGATHGGMGNIEYSGDSAYVNLQNLIYGENCVIREAIRVPIDGSQEYHHYFIFEVLDQNDNPRILTLYLGSTGGTSEWFETQGYVQTIKSHIDQQLTISLLTRLINRTGYNSLYMYSITDTLSPTLIQELNNDVIPNDIWRTIIFTQFG